MSNGKEEMGDVKCTLCDSGDNEDSLLLCDGCNKGLHTYCINLTAVPNGDWFCPACVRRRAAAAPPAAGPAGPVRVMGPGIRVAFYIRVSSAGQNEPEYGRVGMETQNQELLNFAQKNGLVVLQTANEVGTATKELTELVKLTEVVADRTKQSQVGKRKGVVMRPECIVVHTVSRFARNVAIANALLARIHANGGWVYSVVENVYSYEPRFATLLAGAQTESEQLGARVRASVERIRQQGGHIGPAPFGYTVERNAAGLRVLVKNDHEQAIVDQLKTILKNAGPKKFTATAKFANEAGLKNRGNKWTPDTVARVLMNSNVTSADVAKMLSDMKL